MRLSQVSRGRDNNLNLLRVLAAAAVLVSHAYPITRGPEAEEPLHNLTGFTLGTVAVYVFFVVSGFLIAKSFEGSKGVLDWSAARVLRLFPGLFVALALTVLVLGPIVTTLPLAAYFADPATLAYLPQNLALIAQRFDLPGVFVGNPYPSAVNGSLWTLFYGNLLPGRASPRLGRHPGKSLANVLGPRGIRRLPGGGR